MAVEAEPLPAARERPALKLPSLAGLGPAFARAAVDTAKVVVPPIVTLAILLAVWQIAFSGKGSAIPTPTKVVADTWELIIDPFFDRGGLDKGLALHILESLKRVAVGFTISAAVGILLGVLIGTSKLAFRGLDPIFQVLRTVPPLAWLPIALAAFRESQPAAIFVIAITAVWPIMMNTAAGISNIPQDYRNVARVLQLNPLEFFWKITLPSTVPYIFTGLKIGIGLSWLAIVAAEMLVGGVGIGFFLWDSWNSSLISEIILALVYIGLVGLLLDRAITLLGRAIGGPGTF